MPLLQYRVYGWRQWVCGYVHVQAYGPTPQDLENLFLALQIQLGLISLATWPHEKGLF